MKFIWTASFSADSVTVLSTEKAFYYQLVHPKKCSTILYWKRVTGQS